jgi:hypothetical protein
MAVRLQTIFTGLIFPVVALLSVALLSAPAESGSGNPFDKLKGYWTGGGTVTPPKGQTEKVSCRVTYSVAGSAVTQNMRCAGTDYKFHTSAQLTYNGGRISGSWSETIYDASGSVSGTASANRVNASINGNKFSGRLSISVSGSRHTINIVQLDKRSGSYRRAASVSLHR